MKNIAYTHKQTHTYTHTQTHTAQTKTRCIIIKFPACLINIHWMTNFYLLPLLTLAFFADRNDFIK